MILAIRTDKPEAELYLLDDNGKEVAKNIWRADRSLADTLLVQIKDFLKKNNILYRDLAGVIIFSGQGSFTGLRIGTTVANTLAYSLHIPIAKSTNVDWFSDGFKK